MVRHINYCNIFIWFKSCFEAIKKKWNCGIFFITLHLYMKNFATKIFRSNVSSDSKLMSCPKRLIHSFRLTTKMFVHTSLTTVCNCSQNQFTCSCLKKICWIASHSFLQSSLCNSFYHSVPTYPVLFSVPYKFIQCLLWCTNKLVWWVSCH